jgi:hypothetical protein
MGVGRSEHGMAAVDERLYVVGGNDASGKPAASAEYFVAGKGWSSLPPMLVKRAYPVTGAIAGKLYAAGGFDGSRFTPTLEVFDAEKSTWTLQSPMPLGRNGATGAVLGNRLFVIGGASNGGPCETTVQAYDTTMKEWAFFPALPEPRCFAAAATARGKIFVFGGTNFRETVDSIAVFDIYTQKWTTTRPHAPSPIAPPATTSPPAVAASDIDRPPEHRPRRPHDFALIIAIEKYSSLPPALYADRDGAVMAEHLVAFGVPETNITVLSGSSATLTGIQKYTRSWLRRNLDAESRLYFYFSGHGAPDPETGRPFIIPWDADLPFLRETAYPLSVLYDDLGKLPCREVIVLLDACFSGAGERSVLLAGVRPLVIVSNTAVPRKLTVMTASGAQEIAGSSAEQRHGLFTYHLLKGLWQPAENGSLTISRLYEYVRRNVSQAAHRQNREQNPKLYASDPNFSIR